MALGAPEAAVVEDENGTALCKGDGVGFWV